MVDVNKLLKDVVKRGKVKVGEKQTKKAIEEGNAKLVILSNNCPYLKEIVTLAKDKKVPIYNFNANSVELGYVCGKNFAVSSFAVSELGESNILQLVKKGK
jgi:large subunit ribosomal protein L30e